MHVQGLKNIITKCFIYRPVHRWNVQWSNYSYRVYGVTVQENVDRIWNILMSINILLTFKLQLCNVENHYNIITIMMSRSSSYISFGYGYGDLVILLMNSYFTN